MDQLLEQLGLTKGEAAVYLALLEQESASAADLATAAKLKRPDTYNKLTALMARGMASTFKTPTGRTRFRAEHPSALQRYLESQE